MDRLGVPVSEQCEVCGTQLEQFQVVAETQELTGPWYELREHQRHNYTHTWYQVHNCIKREPDACPFCKYWAAA